VSFLFLFCISHFIQLTPQKLSAGRKNLPGTIGVGEFLFFFVYSHFIIKGLHTQSGLSY